MLGIYGKRPLVTHLTIIIVFATMLRTILTAPVEMGGDALKKWAFSKELANGVPAADLLANHHTARWGINLPATALAKLVGPEWFTYYLVPGIFFGLLLIAAAYFITKWSKQPLFVFMVFVLVLFGEPMYFRSTSQLQPFVFSATYMLCHAIFLGKITESATQRNHFFAALFIFLAYGAKETAMNYIPATAIFIFASLGWRQGMKSLALIGSYGIALLVVETAYFSVMYGEIVTRLHLVGQHFEMLEDNIKEDLGEMSLSLLFRRWTNLPVLTTVLLASGLVSSAWIFVKSIKEKRATPDALPSLFFVSFAVVSTLAVKSFDPLVPLEPPKAKYLAELVPWASLAVALFMGYAVDGVNARLARRIAMGAIIGVAATASLVSVAMPGKHDDRWAAWMWHADDTYKLLRDIVEAGVPIRVVRPGLFADVLGVELVPLEGTVANNIFVAPAFRTAYRHRELPLSCASLSMRFEFTFSQCPAKATESQ